MIRFQRLQTTRTIPQPGRTIIKTQNAITTAVEGIMEIRFGPTVRTTFTISRIQL